MMNRSLTSQLPHHTTTNKSRKAAEWILAVFGHEFRRVNCRTPAMVRLPGQKCPERRHCPGVYYFVDSIKRGKTESGCYRFGPDLRRPNLATLHLRTPKQMRSANSSAPDPASTHPPRAPIVVVMRPSHRVPTHAHTCLCARYLLSAARRNRRPRKRSHRRVRCPASSRSMTIVLVAISGIRQSPPCRRWGAGHRAASGCGGL